MRTRNEATSKEFTAQDAMEDEYAHLFGHASDAQGDSSFEGIDRRKKRLRELIHEMSDEDAPWALCLSGGGIRSATFNLGVLQQLASLKLLRRFNYLSTVSGGGYIGSWLSRWLVAANGKVVQVEAALAGGVQGSGASEAPQVSQLRSYSNYLSPVQGLSSDFFTLVSIVLRNLVLNWLVLIPLIAAALLIPSLYLGLLNLPWSKAIPLISAGVCIVVGLRYVVADLPQRQPPEPSPINRFTLYCFLPVLLAAILVSVGMRNLKGFTFWDACGAGAILHLLACMAGLKWTRPSAMAAEFSNTRALYVALRSSTPASLSLVLFSGALGGGFVYLVTKYIPDAFSNIYADAKFYAVLTVPALLMGIWMATTVHVAFKRKETSEDQREWWARSGGWWILASLLWTFSFTLVLFTPKWVTSLVGEHTGAYLVGGSAWGILTGLLGYWSKNGSAITGRMRGIAATIGTSILDLAALAFIVALLIAMILALDWGRSELASAEILRNADVFGLILFVSLLGIGWGASRVVGVNTFSIHSMYGNRLVRAYFGAARSAQKRSPHWFTGFDDGDNVSMHDLRTAKDDTGRPRLFHVVNLALNMVAPSGTRLEWQQRKAASFSVTPLHAGCAEVGYVPSKDYAGPPGKGISLARAMTISGAAASPNMGYQSSAPIAFVMALFNVRLGWWLPNTGAKHKSIWSEGEPKASGLRLLLTEAFGLTTADQPYVYLSDGGHFDNLGLYEMIRRRCRNVLVVDASADPEFSYEDLQNALRKIRIDLGISIEFDKDCFKTPYEYRIGRIHYGDIDAGAGDGVLCYLKPCISGDEPLDVLSYAEWSRKNDVDAVFPHQTTSDQFFDETQFESYRMLGSHMLKNAFATPWVKPVVSREPFVVPPPPDQPPFRCAARQQDRDGHGVIARIADSAHQLSQGAILASAITVGGALGITGTIALKDATVSLKEGTVIGIKKESLQALGASVPDESLNTSKLEALTLQLENLATALKAAGEITLKTAEAQRANAEIVSRLQELTSALSARVLTMESSKTGEELKRLSDMLEKLKSILDSTTKRIEDVASKLEKTTHWDAMNKSIAIIESDINAIRVAIQTQETRRNIRGVEGAGR